MKHYKKAVTLSLSIGLLFSLCSCAQDTKETSEPASEETAAATTVQETEETEASETETITATTDYMDPDRGETGTVCYRRDIFGGNLESLLGYDNVRFIGERYSYGGAVIYFYTEDNVEIAKQFGPGLFDPWFYSIDLDGDGVDEMICPCVYLGDNSPCVLIYRNNGGVIEVGYPDRSRFEELAGEELYVLNSCSRYDFDTDRIVLYYRGEELAELTIDDYVFHEYEPEYYFRDNDIWPDD
ncbi:MAG: hypothetical protein J5685_00275 [Clostridiales bacterium]|nr:hypothetical protein [Clostridiales bacterium]